VKRKVIQIGWNSSLSFMALQYICVKGSVVDGLVGRVSFSLYWCCCPIFFITARRCHFFLTLALTTAAVVAIAKTMRVTLSPGYASMPVAAATAATTATTTSLCATEHILTLPVRIILAHLLSKCPRRYLGTSHIPIAVLAATATDLLED
jgi:hypothetical protein